MKSIILFITFFLTFFSPLSFANTKTPADIKLELISVMEKDGYLSQKMAGEVAQKYITEEDKKQNVTNEIKVELPRAKARGFLFHWKQPWTS